MTSQCTIFRLLSPTGRASFTEEADNYYQVNIAEKMLRHRRVNNYAFVCFAKYRGGTWK